MDEEGGISPTTTSRYTIITEVGRGGYGNVFKVLYNHTGEIVALKKVNTFALHNGLPQSFYREMKCLKEMNNENIIKLKGIEHNRNEQCLYLVLDYCEYDLAGLIRINSLSFEHKREFIKELLNIFNASKRLYSSRYHIIKLGYPELARKLYQQNRPLTHKVVTPSYRAPEPILGDPHYDQAVDVWSLFCVIYEIITGKVLNKPSTSSDILRLDSIFRICGSPNEDNWPSFQQLPKAQYASMTSLYDSKIEEVLQNTLSYEFMEIKDLIKSMLQLDPKNRISLETALSNPFLYESFELPKLSIPEFHVMDVIYEPLNIIKVSGPVTRPKRIVPP